MAYILNTPQSPSTYGNLTVGHLTVGSPNYSTSATSTSASSYVWGGSSAAWGVSANPVTITQQATIELKGEDADVIMNNVSLKDFMTMIQERLGWMVPNPELELEFDELKKLGDAYRKMEAECKEKMKVWNTLKDRTL